MDVDIFNSFLRDVNDLDELDNFMSVKFLQHKVCANKAPTTLLKSRRKRFNPLLELSEHEFKEKYRFTKENMIKLIEVIRDDLELERPSGVGGGGTAKQVPVEMQVLVAIRQWGLNEMPELLADIHDITVHTLEKICRRVAAAFSSKASRYIRMPATLAEKEQVTRNFHAIAEFPQVIGAVDCQSLHLKKIKKTESNTESNFQSECSMNIQIISDASLKIRDFDYRLRPLSKSIYNDQQIFPETRIKERFEQNEFRGRLLLGNASYAGTSYLYTPVAPDNITNLKVDKFNRKHAATQAAVKRCQYFWRQRFLIIQDELACTSFSSAKHLIVALAVLHNISIDLNDSCAELLDDFWRYKIIDNPSKGYLLRDEVLEKCGAESRSAFIIKYF